jgi:hypothetical protein
MLHSHPTQYYPEIPELKVGGTYIQNKMLEKIRNISQPAGENGIAADKW